MQHFSDPQSTQRSQIRNLRTRVECQKASKLHVRRRSRLCPVREMSLADKTLFTSRFSYRNIHNPQNIFNCRLLSVESQGNSPFFVGLSPLQTFL